MSNLIDMTGWVMAEHGVPDSRLTVIGRAKNHTTPNGCIKTQWLCECSCEEHNRIITTGERIRQGVTKSCGCYEKEKATEHIKRVQYLAAELTKKRNEYTFFENYGQGKFSNCNGIFLFDLEDYDKIKDYCWYKCDGYAKTSSRNSDNKYKTISMHELLGFKYHDHINRNRADNRKSNLRVATSQENVRNSGIRQCNTSGYIGVTWKKDRQKWKSYISINGKQVHLGYFGNKDEAVKARLQAEKKYFGEFAPQKNLFLQYGITQLDV